MQTYLKTRSVGSQSLIFLSLVFSGLLIFVAMLGTWAATKFAGLSLFEIGDLEHWDFKDNRYLLFLRIMLAAQFVGLFLVPTLLFAYFSDPSPARYLGLRRSPAFLFGMAILLMLAAFPLVESLGYLNQKLAFPKGIETWMKTAEKEAQQQINMLLQQRNVGNLILNVVMVAGFAAVGEELFFRGVVQRLAIWGFKNAWIGILLSAFLFSALHLQFYGFLPRFFLGILLGAIYWYSGSIWPAILAHFFYDAALILLAYFNPRMITDDQASLIPGPSLLTLGLISAAATTALLIYLRKRSSADLHQFLQERQIDQTPPFTFEQ